MPARRLLACLFAATLLVGACGDDDAEDSSPVTVDPDEDTTTTSEPSPTTTSEASTTTIDPEDPTAEVQQAFLDQWDAYIEILSNADPENPLIDQHFTGDAKLRLLNTIVDFARERKVARLPEDPADFQPRVIEARLESPTTALVFECTIDGIVVANGDTGEIINDSVDTFEARNELELVDGQWKVASTTSALQEGDPTCADL